ncbi:MAG: hypothetical protein U0R68_06645 [Candidatus Nanopelagicales bacterium]
MDELAERDRLSSRWAVAVMVVALVLFVAAPARVWWHVVFVSIGDASVEPVLMLFWVVMAFAPITVGLVVWWRLAGRNPRRRFVVASICACVVGAMTMVIITPYLFAF